jgi:hypothetical protein
VRKLIVFKRNELLRVNGTPARYLAQNMEEYLFIALERDWNTEIEIIRIPARNINKVSIQKRINY